MASKHQHYLVVDTRFERIAPCEPEDGQTILIFRPDEDDEHTAEIRSYWQDPKRDRPTAFGTTVEAFCHYGEWELNFGGGGRDLQTSKLLVWLQERMLFFIEFLANDAARNAWECKPGCVQDVWAHRDFPGWNVGATRSFDIIQTEWGCYAMRPYNASTFAVYGPVAAPLSEEGLQQLGAWMDATRKGEAVDLNKCRILNPWDKLVGTESL